MNKRQDNIQDRFVYETNNKFKNKNKIWKIEFELIFIATCTQRKIKLPSLNEYLKKLYGIKLEYKIQQIF